jgi:hypothetical protein
MKGFRDVQLNGHKAHGLLNGLDNFVKNVHVVEHPASCTTPFCLGENVMTDRNFLSIIPQHNRFLMQLIMLCM